MIKPGEEWGTPTAAPPDFEVAGGDADLAAAVATHPGALIRFRPGPASDLARAVGIDASATIGTEVALDALQVDGLSGSKTMALAVNMVAVGIAPDRCGRFTRRIDVDLTVDGSPWWAGRATAVVVATGEFLRGNDLVPRGHPGDGRAEVQVYAVAPGERARLRARLATGTHLPHPRIAQRAGTQIELRVTGSAPVEIDGLAAPAAQQLTITVRPKAYRLLL